MAEKFACEDQVEALQHLRMLQLQMQSSFKWIVNVHSYLNSIQKVPALPCPQLCRLYNYSVCRDGKSCPHLHVCQGCFSSAHNVLHCVE